jgi:hypothetical protein
LTFFKEHGAYQDVYRSEQNSNPSTNCLLLEGYSERVLEALPERIATRSWPRSSELERVYALVVAALSSNPPRIGDRFAAEEARRLIGLFLEQARIPELQALSGLASLTPEMASSIGARFVGRADTLRRLHRTLFEGGTSSARLAARLTAAGGFGKTRLAIEYCTATDHVTTRVAFSGLTHDRLMSRHRSGGFLRELERYERSPDFSRDFNAVIRLLIRRRREFPATDLA